MTLQISMGYHGPFPIECKKESSFLLFMMSNYTRNMVMVHKLKGVSFGLYYPIKVILKF